VTEDDLPGPIVNTASASSDETPDPLSDDHEVPIVVTTQSADLSLSKSVDNAAPSEGESIVYTITITNDGPSDATGVEITDLLPLWITHVSDSSAGSYNRITGVWAVGALADGNSATLEITAIVDAGIAGITIPNTAEVTAADQPDPDSTPDNNDPTEDDQDSADITVQHADLAVTKTVDNATPNEGDTIVYTITVTNNGPDDATGVEVTDVLPLGVTYASDDSAGAYDSVTGVWTIGALASGANAMIELTVTVDAETAGKTITNTVELTGSDQADPDNTNNRSSVDITVQEVVTAGVGGATEDSCQSKVIISEIAWAGTAADPWGEWIELRNLGRTSVDLTDWTLRWRRKHPSTPEESRWKVLKLSGMLMSAPFSVCELADREPTPSVRIVKNDADDFSWLLLGELEEKDGSYYLLERWHDATVSNVTADLVYDTEPPYDLELSDFGDMIILVNDQGEIVDTANAFEFEKDGWPAGSATTFATMERTDPLGPDTKENWHTNQGILTHGLDALRRPLVASAGVINSMVLDELALFSDLQPAEIHVGTQLEAGIEVAMNVRKAPGWPWVHVTSPGLAEAAGIGGAIDYRAGYTFSGYYKEDTYWLGINTDDLAPGRYNFWIPYGEGKTMIIPITVVP